MTEPALAEDMSARAVRLRLTRTDAGEDGTPARLDRVSAIGERVFAIVRISIADEGGGPRVAIRGRVLRGGRRPGGEVDVVIEVERSRWLFAPGGTAS